MPDPLATIRQALLNLYRHVPGPVEPFKGIYDGALAAVDEAERRYTAAVIERDGLRVEYDERTHELEAAEARAATWEAEYREEQRRTSTADERALALEARAEAAQERMRLELVRVDGVAREATERAAAAEQALEALRERAEREPLDVDISDYSDGFCAGFLAGQANALDTLREALGAQRQEGAGAWNAEQAMQASVENEQRQEGGE